MHPVSHSELHHATEAPPTPERLHARVVKVLAVLTIAPLVLSAVISLVVTISLSRQEVTTDQQRLALTISEILRERWRHTIDDLRASASSIGRTPPEDDPTGLARLQHVCEPCEAIWLVDASGRIEQQVGTPGLALPPDSEVRVALASGTEVIQLRAPAHDRPSDMVLVLPVQVAGKPWGALVTLLNLQQLGSQVLAPLQFEHAAYAYVTDRTGRLLISPRPEQVPAGRDVRAIPLVAAGLQGKEWVPPYSQDYTGLLAPLVDGVWYHMSEPDWYVFVEAPLSLSSAHNWYLFAVQGVLLVLTGGTAIILGRRLAATITKPIEQLQRGVRRLQAGDWALPLPVGRQDEIGQLANAFNAMAHDLQTKQVALLTRSDELLLANRELEKALATARNANALKSQFVATISHELRTPLTAMLGFSDLLEIGVYGPLEGEQLDIINRISKNGHHLLNLINDLLDFSKLEAGKVQLSDEQFSLPDFMTTVLKVSDSLVREKSLTLHTEIDPALPTLLFGDALRLRQIVLNLLSNAIKFTAQGTITLRVRYQEQSTANKGATTQQAAVATATLQHWLVIDVADTGIGIAPEDQTAIFELFRQVDGDYARRHGGTGLGLAITRNLVELMNGTITVASSLGEGSCFTVTLPLRSADEAIVESDTGI
jgi:signal transduction histidine kinase